MHSLHRIDEEIPDTPENTLMLDENGRRIRSLDQAAPNGQAPDGDEKKENDADKNEKTNGGQGSADKASGSDPAEK